MKFKPLVIAVICIAGLALVILIPTIKRMNNYIDTSFASEITLRYYYNDKKIDVMITDDDDIRAIKSSFQGMLYTDNPSCGFSEGISLTLSNREKSLVLYPACDGCSRARIGDSGMYVDTINIEALKAVLAKYGMTLPCV